MGYARRPTDRVATAEQPRMACGGSLLFPSMLLRTKSNGRYRMEGAHQRRKKQTKEQ